ncbi:MAG: outer membrane beta-barrel domain-containing protein [Gammaproteobacteria bacterium]|nr:outer membrane beta-barrel domain-containing protein [Gammaproteobacteria bacterium]
MEIRVFILFLRWLNRVRRSNRVASLVALVSLVAALPVIALEGPLPAGQPLINPEVERKEIIEAKIDTEDLEVGIFGGLYSTEDFGTNPVVGVRLAYHITEDFFLELAAGQSNTRESTLEEFARLAILNDDERKLSYYNFSIGYNLLPGEAFVTANWSFYTAFYLIAGIGNTKFAGDDAFTINTGVGYRFIATDWMAIHVDFRNHIFDMDLLGVKKTTNNLELHTGITFFF